jgi:hypothetical protein
MTTIITVTGVDAADNSIGFAPPVSSGLVGWFHIGTDATSSIRNRASGGSAASVAGSPTFSSGYGSFSSTANRIDTANADTAATTLLVVARSSDDFSVSTERPLLLGAYNAIGSDFYGSGIMVTGTPSSAPAATVVFRAGRDVASVSTMASASITVSDLSEWTFLAGGCPAAAAATGRVIYDKTNGTSNVASVATDRIVHPSRTHQIGAASSSLVQGGSDVAWAAIYNRLLSEAEIDKIYIFVKRRLADKFSIAI